MNISWIKCWIMSISICIIVVNGFVCKKRGQHLVKGRICIDCTICQPGEGLTVACNNLWPVERNSISCKPCLDGTFSFGKSPNIICKKCNDVCGYNEKELIPCTSKTNRVCRCQDNYYRDFSENCTRECCYCGKNDTVEQDCIAMENDKNCGNFEDDGKCRVDGTEETDRTGSPTKKTHTTKEKGREKNESENEAENIPYIILYVVVAAIFLFIIILVYDRCWHCSHENQNNNNNDRVSYVRATEDVCVSSTSDTASIRRRINSTNNDEAGEEMLLPLEDILNIGNFTCPVPGCQKEFDGKLYADLDGTEKVNVEDRFSDVHNSDVYIRKLAKILEFPYPNTFNETNFWSTLGVRLPELTCKSLVYLMKYLRRNDVVITFHNLLHREN